MHRFFLVSLIAALGLLAPALSSTASAQAAPKDEQAAFQRFQGRVCQLAKTMANEASPYVLKFNNYFFNETEHDPANMGIAGRELRQAYTIYQRFNQRLLAIHAPAGSARLWHTYAQQERQVLTLGFQGAAALEAAELETFQRIKTENENWQRERNATWARIGIVCP